MKKILFIIFLSISTIGFAQQDQLNNASKFHQQKTISNLNASPNPLTIENKISFTCSEPEKVTLRVKNLLGKTVFLKTISAKKGKNKIFFQRGNLESGMYIYSLQAKSEVTSKRLVIR
jgi:ATPase subunit of ABC transporter with duplicated ATPase domains